MLLGRDLRFRRLVYSFEYDGNPLWKFEISVRRNVRIVQRTRR